MEQEPEFWLTSHLLGSSPPPQQLHIMDTGGKQELILTKDSMYQPLCDSCVSLHNPKAGPMAIPISPGRAGDCIHLCSHLEKESLPRLSRRKTEMIPVKGLSIHLRD